MSLFGKAEDREYDSLVAENAFITEVQLAIEAALAERGMSQRELADALSVTEARVSQILSANGKNLQARTIARIAHALGMTIDIEFCDGGAQWLGEVVSSEPISAEAFDAWMQTACESIEKASGLEWPMTHMNSDWISVANSECAPKLVAA